MAPSIAVENLNPKVRTPPVFLPLSSCLSIEGSILVDFSVGSLGFDETEEALGCAAFFVSLIQLSRGVDSCLLEKFGVKKNLSLIRWSGTCRA